MLQRLLQICEDACMTIAAVWKPKGLKSEGVGATSRPLHAAVCLQLSRLVWMHASYCT